MAFFPALNLALIVASLLSPFPILGFIAAVYLFPLLCFHVHDFFFPLREGTTDISAKVYSPWWGGHQIQLVLGTIPAFEAILRIIPGVYSAWLRAWGSHVGRGVYWTPSIRIEDRSFMEIGNHVVFGHQSQCLAHIIVPKSGKTLLIVKKVRIGDGAFIGGAAGIGPGGVVKAGAFVPMMKIVTINEIFPPDESASVARN